MRFRSRKKQRILPLLASAVTAGSALTFNSTFASDDGATPTSVGSSHHAQAVQAATPLSTAEQRALDLVQKRENAFKRQRSIKTVEYWEHMISVHKARLEGGLLNNLSEYKAELELYEEALRRQAECCDKNKELREEQLKSHAQLQDEARLRQAEEEARRHQREEDLAVEKKSAIQKYGEGTLEYWRHMVTFHQERFNGYGLFDPERDPEGRLLSEAQRIRDELEEQQLCRLYGEGTLEYWRQMVMFHQVRLNRYWWFNPEIESRALLLREALRKRGELEEQQLRRQREEELANEQKSAIRRFGEGTLGYWECMEQYHSHRLSWYREGSSEYEAHKVLLNEARFKCGILEEQQIRRQVESQELRARESMEQERQISLARLEAIRKFGEGTLEYWKFMQDFHEERLSRFRRGDPERELDERLYREAFRKYDELFIQKSIHKIEIKSGERIGVPHTFTPQGLIDQQITRITEQASVLPKGLDPKRAGDNFKPQELGCAASILQGMGSAIDLQMTALCVVFSPERAKALLEAILNGDHV